MIRYSKILKKNPREIVLLRSRPCGWGRCLFCDYIDDNSQNLEEMISLNREILSGVTGEFGTLEVINSASVFELPKQTLQEIRDLCDWKKIHTIYFEAYFNYRFRLEEIRDYFSNQVVHFKCGIETFDEKFRNDYLQKNITFHKIADVRKYFDTICLLVGIKGQTEQMIQEDIKIATDHFERICINIFTENSTVVKKDPKLIQWFYDHYKHLEKNDRIEILWNNTDFGVGTNEKYD